MSKGNGKGVLMLHSSADLYGSDRSLLRLAAGLQKVGYRPHAVLPCDGPLCAELAYEGVAFTVMPLGIWRRRLATPWGISGTLWEGRRAVRRLQALIQHKEISLLHSNTLAVPIGGIVAARARIPHVWYAREITGPEEWVTKILRRLLERRADRIVAVSEAVRDHWVARSADLASKTTVVHSGMEWQEEQLPQEQARREMGLPEGSLIVGMVGRINRVKGYEALAEAAGRLLEQRPDTLVLCAGDATPEEQGRYRTLRRDVEASPWGSRFRFLGFVKHLRAFYAACDVVVAPSVLPDSLPGVCIEAGLAGRPVVAFATGGIPEIVLNGITGLCVPPGDVEGLRQALGVLLTDGSLRARMGLEARMRCRKKFSLDKQLHALVRVYEEALAAAPRRGPG